MSLVSSVGSAVSTVAGGLGTVASRAATGTAYLFKNHTVTALFGTGSIVSLGWLARSHMRVEGIKVTISANQQELNAAKKEGQADALPDVVKVDTRGRVSFTKQADSWESVVALFERGPLKNAMSEIKRAHGQNEVARAEFEDLVTAWDSFIKHLEGQANRAKAAIETFRQAVAVPVAELAGIASTNLVVTEGKKGTKTVKRTTDGAKVTTPRGRKSSSRHELALFPFQLKGFAERLKGEVTRENLVEELTALNVLLKKHGDLLSKNLGEDGSKAAYSKWAPLISEKAVAERLKATYPNKEAKEDGSAQMKLETFLKLLKDQGTAHISDSIQKKSQTDKDLAAVAAFAFFAAALATYSVGPHLTKTRFSWVR